MPLLLEILDELVEVALFCSRNINALFCDELLLLPLRDVPLVWNMFCSTYTACWGSPLFM